LGIFRPGDGWINLIVDNDAKTVTIRDNGIGVHSKDNLRLPYKYGMSRNASIPMPDSEVSVRLAGMAYCDRLTFRTSAYGEAVDTSLYIDCEINKGCHLTRHAKKLRVIRCHNE